MRLTVMTGYQWRNYTVATVAMLTVTIYATTIVTKSDDHYCHSDLWTAAIPSTSFLPDLAELYPFLDSASLNQLTPHDNVDDAHLVRCLYDRIAAGRTRPLLSASSPVAQLLGQLQRFCDNLSFTILDQAGTAEPSATLFRWRRALHAYWPSLWVAFQRWSSTARQQFLMEFDSLAFGIASATSQSYPFTFHHACQLTLLAESEFHQEMIVIRDHLYDSAVSISHTALDVFLMELFRTPTTEPEFDQLTDTDDGSGLVPIMVANVPEQVVTSARDIAVSAVVRPTSPGNVPDAEWTSSDAAVVTVSGAQSAGPRPGMSSAPGPSCHTSTSDAIIVPEESGHVGDRPNAQWTISDLEWESQLRETPSKQQELDGPDRDAVVVDHVPGPGLSPDKSPSADAALITSQPGPDIGSRNPPRPCSSRKQLKKRAKKRLTEGQHGPVPPAAAADPTPKVVRRTAASASSGQPFSDGGGAAQSEPDAASASAAPPPYSAEPLRIHLRNLLMDVAARRLPVNLTQFVLDFIHCDRASYDDRSVSARVELTPDRIRQVVDGVRSSLDGFVDWAVAEVTPDLWRWSTAFRACQARVLRPYLTSTMPPDSSPDLAALVRAAVSQYLMFVFALQVQAGHNFVQRLASDGLRFQWASLSLRPFLELVWARTVEIRDELALSLMEIVPDDGLARIGARVADAYRHGPGDGPAPGRGSQFRLQFRNIPSVHSLELALDLTPIRVKTVSQMAATDAAFLRGLRRFLLSRSMQAVSCIVEGAAAAVSPTTTTPPPTMTMTPRAGSETDHFAIPLQIADRHSFVEMLVQDSVASCSNRVDEDVAEVLGRLRQHLLSARPTPSAGADVLAAQTLVLVDTVCGMLERHAATVADLHLEQLHFTFSGHPARAKDAANPFHHITKKAIKGCRLELNAISDREYRERAMARCSQVRLRFWAATTELVSLPVATVMTRRFSDYIDKQLPSMQPTIK